MCFPVLFFFKIALDILISLHFYIHFKFSLSVSTKKAWWDYGWDWVESLDQFGKNRNINHDSCQSVNLISCLSVFIFFDFFSTVFYSFQCWDLAYILSFFLSVLCFWCHFNYTVAPPHLFLLLAAQNGGLVNRWITTSW